MLRWCHPVHAGDMSWCLERGGGGHSDVKAPTGRLYLWRFSMLPSPCGMFVSCFGVVSKRIALETPSAEDATAIEVAMMSRPAWLLRHHRGALGRRDKVASALAAAICSPPEGLSRERGCYHCLGPPSSCALVGAFGATSILESQTLELRGKRWLGQWRRVICRTLLHGLGHRGWPEFYQVRLLSSGRAYAWRR
ncbi:hypothetical protein Taro_006502 [Colocasia esculenta]|uniref:Uncharacterized protein n=1 Tax=Colocasia esculenta TaxID=4460 RepID=A0A843TX70_COLES|nr:hypothetical protein [Colocasia esculenta]